MRITKFIDWLIAKKISISDDGELLSLNEEIFSPQFFVLIAAISIFIALSSQSKAGIFYSAASVVFEFYMFILFYMLPVSLLSESNSVWKTLDAFVFAVYALCAIKLFFIEHIRPPPKAYLRFPAFAAAAFSLKLLLGLEPLGDLTAALIFLCILSTEAAFLLWMRSKKAANAP